MILNNKNWAVGTLVFLIAACSFAWEAGENIDVHGSFSQGYLNSSGNNIIEDSLGGTFDFREYVLNAQYEPLDNLLFGAQVIGREYGEVGNDELQLDWAVLDYRFKNELGIRLGKIRVPYGLYHETRDFDGLRTEVLLPQGVYMEYMREFWGSQLGAALYGTIMTEDKGAFVYLLTYGDRKIDKTDGDMARLLSSGGITIEDYDMSDAFAGSIQWLTPWDGLRFGLTYSFMQYEIDGLLELPVGTTSISMDVDDNYAIVGSVEYERGPVTLASEYVETAYDSVAVIPGSPFSGVDMSGKFRGYYFSGTYRWTEEISSALGFSRFPVTDDSFSNLASVPQPDHSDFQEDTYVSLRVDATSFLIFKVEYHWISGSAGIFDLDEQGDVSEHSDFLAAKATVMF